MKEQVDALLAELKAGLDSGTEVTPLLNGALARLQALSPITETDRFHHLFGFVRFQEILLAFSEPEESERLNAEREQLLVFIRRLYGSAETAYIQSRSIVERLAHALRSEGASATELVEQAFTELNALAFDEEDSTAKLTATLAIHALHALRNWQSVDDSTRDETHPIVVIVHRLESDLKEHGFSRDVVLKAATTVREKRLGSAEGLAEGHASALMIVFGVGLQAAPDALPALESVRDLLLEAMAEIDPSPVASEQQSDLSSKCDALLAELERGLVHEGFSEYLLRQCLAGLQELDSETAEDAATVRAALVRAIDITVPHAPPEGAQTLLVSREAIVQQGEPPQGPLDAASLKAEGEAILQRLKELLAAGSMVAPEVTRALAAMQALGARIPEDGKEATEVLLALMPKIVAIAAQYAPPELQDTAQDATTFLSDLMGHAKTVMNSEGADALVEQQAYELTAARFNQTLTADPWDSPEARPHQRQFVHLLRPFSARIQTLISSTEAERDKAEIERLSRSADIAFQRLRAATTDAQWVDQQRKSLRRVAVELRQFERRQHLMLVEPPWPSPAIPIDANAVYFSGSAAVQSLVQEAISQIGMTEAVPHGVDHAARGRWDQLRRSAVAVFDFTTYDRSASDPPSFPRSRKTQVQFMRAAAPVARVAYECGWAFVLGTPFISVVTEGRTMPFDIDIEPVRINGGADDVDRLLENLQGVMYGVQRGSLGSSLSETVKELGIRFGAEAELAPLLKPLSGSRDAMLVHFAASAICERIGGAGLMLTLPAFPPLYPSRDSSGVRRSLFHVTAFREWSRACQEVVREACGDGVEYRIGYEQLNPDILRAIWDDLCTASFVVADLTNLNPNAVLELAIAQALGKPTLIVTQSPDTPLHLPILEKVRIHSYTTGESGRRELTRLIERFLAQETSVKDSA